MTTGASRDRGTSTLASLAGAFGRLAFSLRSKGTPLPRRTLRKATRWTPEEWTQIEHAAAARGVPPLRYVREAALNSAAVAGAAEGSAASNLSRTAGSRRAAQALVNQFARVLSNLRQLHRVAEMEGDDDAELLTAAAVFVEDAISRVPATLGARATDALAGLVEVGNALNVLARRANTAEELPPMPELRAVLKQVEAAVREAIP
ncbi:MAG TPA: hypothetical protein VFR37_00310 [Longimicrobium sp.]|nr:hypothetical protein [Longimicrobium sp.]